MKRTGPPWSRGLHGLRGKSGLMIVGEWFLFKNIQVLIYLYSQGNLTELGGRHRKIIRGFLKWELVLLGRVFFCCFGPIETWSTMVEVRSCSLLQGLNMKPGVVNS